MNQNPNDLALALVHAAVTASQLEEARIVLAQQQSVIAERDKALAEKQESIDAMVRDRALLKEAHAAEIATLQALTVSRLAPDLPA